MPKFFHLPRLVITFATLLAAVFVYALWPVGPAPSVTADRVIVLKNEHKMLLMRGGTILRTYEISIGRSPIGAKVRAGDHKTPEGNYLLDWRNPKSKFHLSIHVSYPNSSDSANAHREGLQPGGDIMIHGLQNGLGWIGRFHRLIDWTDGCVAVTNAEMDQIWRVVTDGTPIEIRP
jgi:murein L,D-transpeptidase YafK